LEEAIDQYQQATSLDPDKVGYHLALARAYRDNGQIAQAVEAYKHVLEMAPDNAAAQRALQELGY
jgi:tetratricopeptide (TPR) repeat protein